MLISTRGRYALRVLIDLAEHQPDRYIPLKDVAQRQGISEKYLETILKTLVRNGIITGMRGKGGGYRLAVSPQRCTVGDILRLTEDSLSPVSCLDAPGEHCPQAGDCRTLDLWQGLEQRITQYLDSFTLADLARAAKPGDDYVI